jgi:uncharacterized protein (DUF427 family)
MSIERVVPVPGQESVWDYPRPPRLERTHKRVRVVFNGVVLADSRRAFRVLETSHPPVYYIPRDDVRVEHLENSGRTSFCEWKGTAEYASVQVGDRRALDAAWSYAHPLPPFEPIAGCVAFYAGPTDGCYVDDERVRPQPGGYYGGWITHDVVGPFKGERGTQGW